MSHARSQSVDSICNVLTCTSHDFDNFYKGGFSTDLLAEESLNNTINGKFHQELKTASVKCRLDKLLEGMVKYAPDPAGRRYVAVAIHVAHEKGAEAVVNLANAWMDLLFSKG